MLSKRIEKIIEMTDDSTVVADIGTDHGYTVIELIKRGKAQYAYGVDISKGSCEKANVNVVSEGLTDKIEIRRADGLKSFTREDGISAVIISGMGGMLMNDILSGGKSVLESCGELILSPQKDIPLVRKHIHSLGYKITDENVVLDEGKFYFIIKAQKGKESYTETEYEFGKCNLLKKSTEFTEYISREYKRTEELLDSKIDSPMLRKRFAILKSVLN